MERPVSRFIILFCAVILIFSTVSISLGAGSEKININTATAEQLAELKGIGPVYAKRIVEYRKANDPFKKPEDIMKVKGIGPKILAANIDIITVE
ncbi:MAG: helix-hairpin-helix domain-containing protein [Pseudomonadota bacterium]|nr:helix-hairpin-helix domain-containing protein [Pseudomonadota bacterium]